MLRRNGWVLRCPACGFFASTLTPGAGTGIGGLERLRRSNFEKLLDRLEKLKPLRGTSLLEVGSARGWFLEAAARRGAQVYGIEPEAANANLARAAGLPVEVGYFPDGLANAGPYDIIVFNDVFEHIPHPSALIGDIEARLAPGGLLVINLPSSGGIFFRLARLLESFGIHGPAERLWQKGFPSPHVSYFKPENLWLLVERRSGLSNESIFSLASVTREGLSSRIKSSHKGTRGALLLAGVWALSFALPLLPADIQVSVFRKPAA
jgi:SAM-dependent methyltransferase